MATLTIDAIVYEVYVTLAAANAYLGGESWATAWRAEADDEVKARAIVSSSRLLDRTIWVGTKTESDQTQAWPRAGISGQEDDEIPQAILDACCVLAGLTLAGEDVITKPTTQSGAVKRQAAGSASIEFFRELSDGTRMPLPVHELIGPYLGGATSGSALGSIASGADTCSRFEIGYGISRGF